MSPALRSVDLSPFKAALIAEATVAGTLPAVANMLKAIQGELSIAAAGERKREQIAIEATASATTPAHGFVHYRDKRPVAWTRVPLFDVEHHLILLVLVGDLVAIAITEGSKRQKLLKAVRRGSIGAVQLVEPARLKAAFVQGDARTLWLKGTHRRASHKPDNKVFTGSDLRDALDPTADQTYRYTAVRSTTANRLIGDVIGQRPSSPRRSRSIPTTGSP
jgi:hypothetical protein